MKPSRGNQIGTALDAIVWMSDRDRAFTIGDYAEGIGCSYRTAQRWVRALEARGLIDHIGFEPNDKGGARGLYLPTMRTHRIAEVAA